MRPRFFRLCFISLLFTSMMVFSSASSVFATSFTQSNALKDKASGSSYTTVTATAQSQTNLPYPSWWNGTKCDTTKVSNSTPLGTYYRGMPACGPIGLPANSSTLVVFPGGWGEYEWQCVELSMRFMYLAYGIRAYNANGNQVVDNYKTYNNNPILQPVTNDGSSKTAPQAGDILSYTTTASPGHTSVVTASNVDSSGNGTITVIEQNFSSTGQRVLKVGANANKSAWVIGSGVKNWLHHTVDITPQSASASAGVAVNGTGFAANEKVSIKFDGTVLSTVTAGSNGSVSTTITVPASASLGTHHIQLVGQTSGFSPKTVLYVVKSSGPPPGTITEFPTPTSMSRPEGITKGPDGNLWFAEEYGNQIGKITPSGTFTEFPVPTYPSDPYWITSGPDGNLWFTELNSSVNKIGKITTNGVVVEYSVPTAGSEPDVITSGPDGNLWFTEYLGNKIGKITPNGTVTEYTIPTSNSYPDGITKGPDGNLWFAESAGNKIGKITPSGTISEFPTPTSYSSPHGITSGPDGNLWFAESGVGKIGKITPSGTFTEFPVPTYPSDPFGITSGPDGNLWFTDLSSKIGKITTNGVVVEYSVPTASSMPEGITSGPDGNLWFTESQGNKIGRITP